MPWGRHSKASRAITWTLTRQRTFYVVKPDHLRQTMRTSERVWLWQELCSNALQVVQAMRQAKELLSLQLMKPTRVFRDLTQQPSI